MWVLFVRGKGQYEVLRVEPGYGIQYRVDGEDRVDDSCGEARTFGVYETRAKAENALLFHSGLITAQQFCGH